MANNVSSFDIKNRGIHISDNVNGLYEVAKTNAFDLLIPTDELLVAGVDEETATTDDYLRDVQNVIRIAVDSTSVPNFKVNPIEVKRNNTTVKYAGSVSWDAGTIKCTDFVGARVNDVLDALRAQVYDSTTDTIHESTNYKHDWTLVAYSCDYSKIIATYTLKGAWISDKSEADFSHDDADTKRQITLTVQYDRCVKESYL